MNRNAFYLVRYCLRYLGSRIRLRHQPAFWYILRTWLKWNRRSYGCALFNFHNIDYPIATHRVFTFDLSTKTQIFTPSQTAATSLPHTGRLFPIRTRNGILKFLRNSFAAASLFLVAARPRMGLSMPRPGVSASTGTGAARGRFPMDLVASSRAAWSLCLNG